MSRCIPSAGRKRRATIATHKLYWAKEVKFGSQPDNTLNYNIRMLGRGGMLVLNGVAAMSQLPEIERPTPKILAAIDFNPGHRSADLNPKSDKIAEYGLAALVVGTAAAAAMKLGFFKALGAAVLAAKKFIIIGAIAIAASVRLFLLPTESFLSEPSDGLIPDDF